MFALLVAVVLNQGANDLPSARAARAAEGQSELSWPTTLPGRFVGALVGGLVGAAVPAVSAAATSVCVAPGFCPVGAGTAVLVVLSPVGSLAGAAIGSALFGGSAPVGAGIAGLTGGMATAAVLLFFSLLMFPPSIPGMTTSIPTWPLIVGASAVAIGIQTLAMDAREDALADHPELAVPAGRFALESTVTFLTIGFGSFLTALVAGVTFNPFVGVALAIALLATAPLIPLAVHRAMGGRGGVAAAYLGWLGSMAAVALGTLGTVLAINGAGSDTRGVGLGVFSIATAVLAGGFGVPLALEFDHGLELLKDPGGPSVSIAPVRGGAIGTVGLRF